MAKLDIFQQLQIILQEIFPEKLLKVKLEKIVKNTFINFSTVEIFKHSKKTFIRRIGDINFTLEILYHFKTRKK